MGKIRVFVLGSVASCELLLCAGIYAQTAADTNSLQILANPGTDSPAREYISDNAPKPSFVSSERRILTAPELPNASDEWLTHSLAWVNFILNAYPPAIPEYPARRAALTRIDDILHLQDAADRPIVQNFYKGRITNAINEIEHTSVNDGVQIWKLYNHGFFIRTKSVSFTFDIVPGSDSSGLVIPPEQIRRIAEQSDATFISHLHSDHANKDVARAFIALGKPVIVPLGLWSDDPEFNGKLTYIDRGIDTVRVIRGTNLKVIAYPGHQDDLLNNVYLVTTPEGYSIVHTGDQWTRTKTYINADYDFFVQMGKKHHVDILLPNAWAPGLHKIVGSVHPNLVITGHEDEMSHAVCHREDYTQTYERMFGIPTPYSVMTWGETYHYDSSDNNRNSEHKQHKTN